LRVGRQIPIKKNSCVMMHEKQIFFIKQQLEISTNDFINNKKILCLDFPKLRY